MNDINSILEHQPYHYKAALDFTSDQRNKFVKFVKLNRLEDKPLLDIQGLSHFLFPPHPLPPKKKATILTANIYFNYEL